MSDNARRVWSTWHILFFLLLWMPVAHAEGGKRIALVVGNGGYANVGVLLNPARDAASISQALRNVGFEVIEGTDVARMQFVERLREFGRRAVGADLALVYYAGHGVQVDGENWLLPTDVILHDKLDLEFEAISATNLLRAMTGAKAKILILDACRDDPFKEGFLGKVASRSVSRGLAPLEVADGGTLIAFATSPGAVAADGANGALSNSPFARALAENIGKPGLEIRQLFTRVRQSVLTATQGRQTPWENSSLLEDIYIGGPPVQSFDPKEVEVTYWKSIQESKNASDFSTFVVKFPNGTFAPLAKEKLHELEVEKSAPPKVERDCPHCPELVAIPAGSFVLGASSTDHEQLANEGPPQHMDVAAFAIGRYPVTFDEWDACVADRGCSSTPADAGWGRGSRPVINVTFADALAYVTWLSRRSGHVYRLPTEIEWEYAARGGTEGPRFWGDDVKQACLYANVFDLSAQQAIKFNWPPHECNDGFAFTSPVGSFRPNPFGLYDMLGNVWQWTSSCWSDHYQAGDVKVASTQPQGCAERVLRGGSWMSDPSKARVSARLRNDAGDSDINIGFRVARDAN